MSFTRQTRVMRGDGVRVKICSLKEPDYRYAKKRRNGLHSVWRSSSLPRQNNNPQFLVEAVYWYGK